MGKANKPRRGRSYRKLRSIDLLYPEPNDALARPRARLALTFSRWGWLAS